MLDGANFGRLYVALPVELRSFEADGGLTNKQNVRMETNARLHRAHLPSDPAAGAARAAVSLDRLVAAAAADALEGSASERGGAAINDAAGGG